MIDHSEMRLGKNAPKHDERTLRLSHYLNLEALPPLPESKDWSGGITDWKIFSNDRIGDCTIASAGHLIMDWTANVGHEVIPSDEDIIAAYSKISGYDPATGMNDNGAFALDVLNYWRKTGIAGHTIEAYSMLDVTNETYVKQSVAIFGGCYIGLALPLIAKHQDVWDVVHHSLLHKVFDGVEHLFGSADPTVPGSWGGHAVPIVGYDHETFTVITWGQPKKMTTAFFNRYCDESFALVSMDFLDAAGETPSGVDLATLESDLVAITNPA